MAARGRPLLCWHDRQEATELWQKADDSTFWSPRKAGYFPDSRQLQAGDIVLFEPLRPTLIQKQIQRFERGTFTHAAVYLHAGHIICEASFRDKRVIFSSLEEHLEENCLLFRRARNVDVRGCKRIALMASTLLIHVTMCGQR